MTDTKKTVLGARNDTALEKARDRYAAADAIVTAGEADIAKLADGSPMRDICEKALKSARNKRDHAKRAIAKLSRSPEERRADQLDLRDETAKAFEGVGFAFHDTGADVGTVVWKQGAIRVTLRPDSPGYAKVAFAAGTVTDYTALADAIMGNFSG